VAVDILTIDTIIALIGVVGLVWGVLWAASTARAATR
jgi:hypothetical protein